MLNERNLVEEFCMSRGFNYKALSAYTKNIFAFRDYIRKSLFYADHEDGKGFIDTLKVQKRVRDENGKIKVIMVDAKPSTKRTVYHQLLSFYNYLVDRGYVNNNPFHSVDVPSPIRTVSDRIPSLEEFEYFFKTIEKKFNIRDYALLLFIASTGLKVSECVNVTWSDFLVDNTGKVALKISTGSKTRFIAILDPVWEIINRYRKEYLMVDESVLRKSAYVFIRSYDVKNYKYNPEGVRKPITIDLVRKLMIEGCRLTNLELFTAKDLRHAHVLFSKKFGASDDEIIEQLGWSNNLMNRYDGAFATSTLSSNSYLEKYFDKIIKG